MRIIFCIADLVAGGTQRRFVELIKGVKSNPGIEFELVIMSRESHYKELFELDLTIHYLIRNSKKDLSVFKKFYDICKDFKPDIVHCWESMTAVFVVPACKLLHITLINGMVVDTPVKQNIFNPQWLRAKLTFPFSTLIIGNSQAGLKGYGAPVKKSSCIYNGMDFSRFDDLKEPSDVRKEVFGSEPGDIFVAGMVAAFEERKDYKTLIAAALSLISSHNNIRFVLVGGGLNFDEIKNSVPASLLNKIIFLGRRSDVESIINIFDVGILLTNTKMHGEGISNSIIEYMALSKPVIATKGGGTNEVVFNGENGFLIDADNQDQLIDKIKILMHNKTMAINLGKKGNQMAHEIFDLKIMTKNYIDVYKKLVKKDVPNSGVASKI